jgi:hypothetical protein
LNVPLTTAQATAQQRDNGYEIEMGPGGVNISVWPSQANMTNYLVALMAFLARAVIFIGTIGVMIGGLMYIFSGSDDGLATKGKEAIVGSLIGISFVLLSWAIVTTLQMFLYSVG